MLVLAVLFETPRFPGSSLGLGLVYWTTCSLYFLCLIVRDPGLSWTQPRVHILPSLEFLYSVKNSLLTRDGHIESSYA